jgi:hypothetical protein
MSKEVNHLGQPMGGPRGRLRRLEVFETPEHIIIEAAYQDCYRGAVLAGPINGTLPAVDNRLPVPVFLVVGCWNDPVKLQIAYQANQRRYWA